LDASRLFCTIIFDFALTEYKKIDYITYGYNILKVTVQPATASDRQVRVIEMKRPRGRKTVMAVIQETLEGTYCGHSVIA
jgi:hypothetical protein